MIDDTRDNDDSGHELEGDLVAEVLELVHFRTDRDDAYGWAKDLKLLAFDNTDGASQPEQAAGCALCATVASAGGEVAEATEEQPLWDCDRCGKHQRLQERFHCSSCNDGNYDICGSCVAEGIHCKDASHQLSYTGTICEHLATNSCRQCLMTQPFPGSGGVQTFRIVRQSWLPRAKEPCTHFVVVSYCWPTNEEDQSEGRYIIRDVDGRTRHNKASEKLIDRAVAFARESGCRFIWIDQECIEQDDPEEKSLAVASMDLVYSRAQCSIAMLDSILDPKIHLPALSTLYEWGQFRNETRNLIGSDQELSVWSQSEQIISLLETVSQERWNTRAWALQEAFSAGEKMFLLFRMPSNSHLTPYSVSRMDLSLSEIAINMDTFAICIYWAKELFTKRPPQYATELIPSIGDFAQHNKDRISDLFQSLEVQFIRPRQAEGGFSKYQLSYPKRSCNAAAALSFLRYRDNTVVPDRVSIFANLCDYDYRLDMAEVEKRPYPLSTSLVALSILNGDYSFLIPEVYDRETKDSTVKEGTTLQLLPSRIQLLKIRYFVPNPLLLVPPQVKHHFSVLQDHSLAFPGFLWKIDSLLDLTWLRDRYGSAWTLILFYTTYFQRVEDEGQSLDDFLRPYIAFFEPTVERPATFNELRSIVSHLAATELTEWKPPYDRRALKIETFALHCSILLYLILFLRENNEMGLADAIWNSAQGASWPIDSQFKDDDDVPASVRDFPDTLPDSLKVDTLFEFETNKQGGWLQSWVAWRIMTRGELWYGNQVETSSDTEEPAPTFQKSESKTEEENIEDLPSTLARTQLGAEPTSANTSSVPQGQTYHGEETSNSEQSTKSQGQADSGPRGRYLNQFTKSILARDVMKMLLEDAGHKTNRNLFHDDPGAYVLFAQLVSTGPGGQSERRDRRAFFDVDEPSLVLTPFNTNMEVLPRPETRAMSASWVVKCSENPPPAISEVDGRAPVVESFKYVKAVKGMWAVGYHAFTRYAVSCVDEPEGEADKKEENHPDSVEQGRK